MAYKVKETFDRKSLAHMDISMRSMMDRRYDLCLYNCTDKRGEIQECKQNCFKDIQVPYRYANHIARDNEEANYRKCLAKRTTFPMLGPEDFTFCSNGLFEDRIEVMSNYVAEEAAKIFNITRP